MSWGVCVFARVCVSERGTEEERDESLFLSIGSQFPVIPLSMGELVESV